MSCYRSSRPDSWTSPRAHTDASIRRRKYGPILPMEYANEPGILTRFLSSIICLFR